MNYFFLKIFFVKISNFYFRKGSYCYYHFWRYYYYYCDCFDCTFIVGQCGRMDESVDVARHLRLVCLRCVSIVATETRQIHKCHRTTCAGVVVLYEFVVLFWYCDARNQHRRINEKLSFIGMNIFKVWL